MFDMSGMGPDARWFGKINNRFVRVAVLIQLLGPDLSINPQSFSFFLVFRKSVIRFSGKA